MGKVWRKFIECACGMEGIMISYEYEDKEKEVYFIDLALFSFGSLGNQLSLQKRLKCCWRTLTTGYPYTDQIMLDKKRAKELAKELLKFANKKSKK